MKKKLWFVLVVVLLVGSLAGCGGGGNDEKKEEKTFTRGVWTENVYTNEYLGLSVTLPEGWDIFTDEEIADLLGVTVDVINEAGVEIDEILLELTTFFDMHIRDPLTGNNVVLQVQNIDGYNLTEAEYIDNGNESYTAMGWTLSEYRTEMLGGQEYTVVDITGIVNGDGVDVSQKMYVRKIDHYMISVIIGVVDGSRMEFDDITSCFSALE